MQMKSSSPSQIMMIPTVFTASKGLEIIHSDIYCQIKCQIFWLRRTDLVKIMQKRVSQSLKETAPCHKKSIKTAPGHGKSNCFSNFNS